LKVTLLHNAKFPVTGYGGTERLVGWLAKGLSELGLEVVLACDPASSCPYARVIPYDEEKNLELDSDILHFFNTPIEIPQKPHLVTIGGNGKVGENYSINTVFVSQNHAFRHGAKAFVYNGLDPDEYLFETKKLPYLTFLAKASWAVKNVKGAVRVARATQRELYIMGGNRWLLNGRRGIHWEGMVDGQVKAQRLSQSAGLIFPVLWNEPFGIAVIEALVSGTPVISTPFGSLSELVHPEVGRICLSYSEMEEAVGQLQSIKPEHCRDWALSKFHYRKMAEKYVGYYEKLLKGETLNKILPMVTAPTGQLLEFS